MNDQLKQKYTSAEIEAVGVLREGNSSAEEKVSGLFVELGDTLLSPPEVSELLGLNKDETEAALNSLLGKELLECSDSTERPLDNEQVTLYRRKDVPFSRLKLLATETQLGDGSSRYHFPCNGRIIRAIAKVDRLDAIAGTGNQRNEVTKHVAQIAEGIKGGTQVPNSILLVIDETRVSEEDDAPESFVRVTPLDAWVEITVPDDSTRIAQTTRTVELDFPFRLAAFDEEKPALLVDGQQRTAALALIDVDDVPNFVLSVNAVRADQEQAKRVFQVANTTVKISTEFSRALMAAMSDTPDYLRSEQARAQAVKMLGLEDKDSPFYGLVQHPGTQRTPRPPIAYNSMFHVVTAFAKSALPIDEDAAVLAATVKKAFQIVKDAWPLAWGKKPSESRLMHGAGLRAIGQLLATKLTMFCFEGSDLDDAKVWDALKESIARLQPLIIWSSAEIGPANATAQRNYKKYIMEVQNTSQDIEDLATWLQKESLALDTSHAKSRKSPSK